MFSPRNTRNTHTLTRMCTLKLIYIYILTFSYMQISINESETLNMNNKNDKNTQNPIYFIYLFIIMFISLFCATQYFIRQHKPLLIYVECETNRAS